MKRREGRCKEGAAAREERGSRYVCGGEGWSNLVPRNDISSLLDQQLSHIHALGIVEGCPLVLRRQGTQRTKEEAMMMRRKGRRMRRGPAERERVRVSEGRFGESQFK